MKPPALVTPLALFCAVLASGPTAAAQSMPQGMTQNDIRPVPLVHGLGNSAHHIATTSTQAQLYFNQGLDYLYAFNHEEAARSFRRAAQLAPSDPMPLWGLALAVGPNYNDIDIGGNRAREAMNALAKARALSQHAPPSERDYVAALSARYRNNAKGEPEILSKPYSEAMAALAKQYPDDPDAATLYAESLMDRNPWKLWTPDGKPVENTETIVATLQGVLAKHPNHVGANHLLIHATEASPHPEIAEASAKRLETLTPAAGHLLHMPAHTYQRIGNFDGAATANERAVKADRAYFDAQHLNGVPNMYDTMYYTHNMHFLASSCSMEGNFACTARASFELVQHVLPEIKANPPIEWYTPTEPWMLVRFNKWQMILTAPVPGDDLPILASMWHYARGMAFTATGKPQQAQAERDILAADAKTLPGKVAPDFNNPTKDVMALALNILDARMAEATGKQDVALQHWQQAVAEWDTFSYNEPPDWYYPVRESLGGALLRAHRPEQAAAVFRQDLRTNPGNGRSLFGLWQSSLAMKQTTEAAKAEAAYRKAWAHADTQLSVATL